jgi:hypothetical protein
MRSATRRTIVGTVAVWMVTAILLEIGLRVAYDSIGPALDQWLGACEGAQAPTPLHHAPRPGPMPIQLGPAYGRYAGLEYVETYDERGIKYSSLRPQDGPGAIVLYDEPNTVPQRAYDWIVEHDAGLRPLIVLNAGYSSYSPVIFTVQASRLLPLLHPDLVVVDIDETDLYDDTVRYRGLIERDERGKMIAVGRDPGREALVNACARAAQSQSYLVRAIATLWYRFRFAVLDWRERRGPRTFGVAETRASDMSPELQTQMREFSTTLDELFATLKEYVPADRVLVVRHPHQRHLQTGHDGMPAMNRQVGELVRAAAARNGIAFFDAQDELSTQCSGEPERYYWNTYDMHFNFDGIRAYGELVGREIARKLRSDRQG